MSIFKILNNNGDVINRVRADSDFMEEHYAGSYEAVVVPAPTADEIARANVRQARSWRDGELTATDHIPAITDHPQLAAYMAYRTALRDWPSTDAFPATKPTLGS
tara:strand:- start:896 stop:1210 length:315 start_codon:yes stop_codon:yes gene_type:complete